MKEGTLWIELSDSTVTLTRVAEVAEIGGGERCVDLPLDSFPTDRIREPRGHTVDARSKVHCRAALRFRYRCWIRWEHGFTRLTINLPAC